MKIKGTFNYQTLAGMAILASTDSTRRPVVCQVQVRRKNGKTCWIATDGRLLGVLQDEGQLVLEEPGGSADITFELPIPKFSLFGLKPKKPTMSFVLDTFTDTAAKEPREIPYAEYSANGITQRIEMRYAASEIKYPNVNQAIPANPEHQVMVSKISFNPEFASRFICALAKVTGIKNDRITFSFADENALGVIIVKVDSPVEFFGILMPMRCGEKPCVIPEWAKAL